MNTAKCSDVFVFIKEHRELAKYKDRELIDESFKIYLYLSTKEQVVFKKEFNEYNIKVAQWV